MKSVAVIGSGITGLMAAYHLAKQGYNVSVFESELYPAMKTSFANGGQISVSNSETWNTWHNVKKGVKWMFKKDAPLAIRSLLSWNKISWLTQFLYHTYNDSYTKNTKNTIQLGIESRAIYDEIRRTENIKYDYSDCGILHFYKTQEYYDRSTLNREMYSSGDWQVLSSPDQISVIEPNLNVSEVIGGAWTGKDSVGDAHKYCHELTQILKNKYNVQFHFGYEIEKLSQSILDSYDAIVVSNGVGAKKLARSIRDSLPIYPVKGYSITIELDETSQRHAPKASLLDDEAKIVTSTLGNRLRVAGTAELAGENYDIRRDRIEPLLKWVHENLPGVSTRNYSSWACLRPMTPNMMPIVRQSKKAPKVFYHCGHGHLGWTLSPATAHLLTDLVTQYLETS